MAAGTSLALPYPNPTLPAPSPTTTSAVKENRRPPLTTLATRLMAMTRSTYGLSAIVLLTTHDPAGRRHRRRRSLWQAERGRGRRAAGSAGRPKHDCLAEQALLA